MAIAEDREVRSRLKYLRIKRFTFMHSLSHMVVPLKQPFQVPVSMPLFSPWNLVAEKSRAGEEQEVQ